MFVGADADAKCLSDSHLTRHRVTVMCDGNVSSPEHFDSDFVSLILSQPNSKCLGCLS